MESNQKSSNVVYKRGNATLQPFQPLENMSKKRPCSTKLDLEKMYEQSLQLAASYKTMMKQNQQLKQKYQQVQKVKLNRQNLIAIVEKIVEEKSKDLSGKQGAHFSWLVFKLNNKIYDLRAKIDSKEKAIREITLSKESETIRQKETQIQCLQQIIEFAKGEGLVKPGFNAKDCPELSQIKQIVWMEQEIKEKETQIIEAEKAYQQQEKEVRKLMQQLAKKKAELKSIKQMQNQYHRAQQLYKQEKRKKQQRIAGNKSYLQELQNQRNEQTKKLQLLKTRYAAMQQQENQSIADLQAELHKVRNQYQQKVRITKQSDIKPSEQKLLEGRKKEVKRVSFEQVKIIGKNINYMLALNLVSHSQISSYFTDEGKDEYSIREVCDRLKKYPFSVRKDNQALLVARYAVEDTGDGYFLEDMDTTQNAYIIKSILTKIIGQVKIYDRQQLQDLRKNVGEVMAKFGKLVQQCLEMKEVGRQSFYKKIRQNDKQFVCQDRLQDALENSLVSLQSESVLYEEIYITLLYLYSYSRDLNQLQVARLFTMKQQDFNWPCEK